MALSLRTGLRPAGTLLATLAALTLSFPAANAFDREKKKTKKPIAEGFVAIELEANPSLTTVRGQDALSQEMRASNGRIATSLEAFMADSSSDWEIRWDGRNDRPHLIQGAGYPLLPGAGNRLDRSAVGLHADAKVQVADVERLTREFLARYPDLLRVSGMDLRLDETRSVSVDNGRSWFIELQQFYRGVPVEGANVYFRVNNGNIVQLGADRIADIPALKIASRSQREPAFAALLAKLGVDRAEVSEVLDAGTQKIYPTPGDGAKREDEFRGAAGKGYTHRVVWEFSFRRSGDTATYKASVDARSGELLRIMDLTVYADVKGGVYPVTNTDPEVSVNFPFFSVTNGTAKVTDANGSYSYSGGTATGTMNGKYFTMSDACGSISLSNSTDGTLNFGTSGGTDCTTPGVGGAGNTHASRSGIYHLTNINRKAKGFLSTNTWLDNNVVSNMNINLTCNAFWNGSTLNFYRSGGGCSNTGELAAVFLHEYGHGIDTNTGGSASEYGSGEAVGDTFAFLETKNSCIGDNFQPGVNCANCTACSGVRDVADFGLAGPAVIAKPANVADNAGINCDRYTCPYLANGVTPYQGPMGYEGHCESYIASGANWDLAQSLVATYGTTAGWSAMDSIWYKSLVPSKSAYQVASGGKCNPAATVNGCGSTNWYTVYLAADDDNGNLADGTPNACRIWDAFNAHGIACGTRPACAGGCTPQAVANAGPDQTIAPGGSVTIGTPAIAGTTYSWAPGGATTAQITVSPASTTTYTVTATTTCGSSNDAAIVTVQSGSTAVYDATLKAPKCAVIGSACDSGASLLLGRSTKGPEPNQPNTINTSCADGTSGTFHSDESNDRLKIETVDGTNLASGKAVKVTATVWAYTTASSDALDIYYAADASAPVWTLAGTVVPPAGGAQALTVNYTLPTGGSLQAVRANFRYQGTAAACSTGAYDDHDDLIFAVGGGAPPDTTAPTTSITSPTGGTVSGTVTINANAADNVAVTRVDFLVDGVVKGSDTTSPYSYAWDTLTATNASHSLTTKAYDAANNVGTSAAVSVTVNNVSAELIVNPSFEGASSSPWVRATNFNWSGTTGGRTGTGRAYAGAATTQDTNMYQQITIPASATGAASAWMWITTAETTTTTVYDTMKVEVRNTSGTLLATLATYSNLNKSTGYVQKTFSLAAYKGQTVRLQFTSHSDSSLLTTFNIDDVSVQ